MCSLYKVPKSTKQKKIIPVTCRENIQDQTANLCICKDASCRHHVLRMPDLKAPVPKRRQMQIRTSGRDYESPVHLMRQEFTMIWGDRSYPALLRFSPTHPH